jgi:hypothetical protein
MLKDTLYLHGEYRDMIVDTLGTLSPKRKTTGEDDH